MTQTRFDTFDHMTHTAYTWLADVADTFDTDDRRFAYRVLRAWLHTLRDRLTVDSAVKLAAQLPELLRGVYYDGWKPSRVPLKYGRDEFAARFADEANIPVDDVPVTAALVSTALRRNFSPGQLDEALDELPSALREMVSGSDAA